MVGAKQRLCRGGERLWIRLDCLRARYFRRPGPAEGTSIPRATKAWSQRWGRVRNRRLRSPAGYRGGPKAGDKGAQWRRRSSSMPTRFGGAVYSRGHFTTKPTAPRLGQADDGHRRPRRPLPSAIRRLVDFWQEQTRCGPSSVNLGRPGGRKRGGPAARLSVRRRFGTVVVRKPVSSRSGGAQVGCQERSATTGGGAFRPCGGCSTGGSPGPACFSAVAVGQRAGEGGFRWVTGRRTPVENRAA